MSTKREWHNFGKERSTEHKNTLSNLGSGGPYDAPKLRSPNIVILLYGHLGDMNRMSRPIWTCQDLNDV